MNKQESSPVQWMTEPDGSILFRLDEASQGKFNCKICRFLKKKYESDKRGANEKIKAWKDFFEMNINEEVFELLVWSGIKTVADEHRTRYWISYLVEDFQI